VKVEKEIDNILTDSQIPVIKDLAFTKTKSEALTSSPDKSSHRLVEDTNTLKTMNSFESANDKHKPKVID